MIGIITGLYGLQAGANADKSVEALKAVSNNTGKYLLLIKTTSVMGTTDENLRGYDMVSGSMIFNIHLRN